MEHGTAAQKEFFLPRIAAGTLHFSVGYSEVDAGTDLAALTTRAVPDGAGGWIFNGHKMWTSQAKYADYVWLAAAPTHRCRGTADCRCSPFRPTCPASPTPRCAPSPGSVRQRPITTTSACPAMR